MFVVVWRVEKTKFQPHLVYGWVITPYHEWAGTGFPLPAGGDKSITEKTTAAAAAADAGVVFYQYGATG